MAKPFYFRRGSLYLWQWREDCLFTYARGLNTYILVVSQIMDAIENETMVHKTMSIYNVDRSVCGRIAGVIAKKYGDTGLAGQLNLT